MVVWISCFARAHVFSQWFTIKIIYLPSLYRVVRYKHRIFDIFAPEQNFRPGFFVYFFSLSFPLLYTKAIVNHHHQQQPQNQSFLFFHNQSSDQKPAKKYSTSIIRLFWFSLCLRTRQPFYSIIPYTTHSIRNKILCHFS